MNNRSKEKAFVLAESNGEDGAGKGTLTRSAIAAILFAKRVIYKGVEYSKENITTIYTDYPNYWGFGALIKTLNSSREFRSQSKVLKEATKDQKLRLRKGLYAMGRLLVLPILLEMREENSEGLTINISDRGPLDQIVTHAAVEADGVDSSSRTDYKAFLITSVHGEMLI